MLFTLFACSVLFALKSRPIGSFTTTRNLAAFSWAIGRPHLHRRRLTAETFACLFLLERAVYPTLDTGIEVYHIVLF